MKVASIQQKFVFSLIALISVLIGNEQAHSWGFYAHQKINRMAVFTLPSEMIGFYKKHIDYISKHAVDADKRRYAIPEEAPRHYIDIEHYGTHPFDSIPEKWKDAVKKFSEDSLDAYGIVPWYIEKMEFKLQKAFEEENVDLILKYSADLGHYVADAHVPLHTTENYNGQLTHQKGIHGFWESRIPELKGENYNYFTGRAVYINSPIEKAWKTIKISHSEVDSVLKFEANLNSKFPSDKKYSFETRGNKTVKEYSTEYTNEYDKLLNGMTERRMRAAIQTVGSMWYTAWVNAGKPNLSNLSKKNLTNNLKKIHEKEEQPVDILKKKELKGH